MLQEQGCQGGSEEGKTRKEEVSPQAGADPLRTAPGVFDPRLRHPPGSFILGVPIWRRKPPSRVTRGDGIGPEIMDAALAVLREAGAGIEVEEAAAGDGGDL
ncbi:MAG: hypothetical protein ACE15B_09610 [Bryobacteraceae bacterium]